MAYWRSAIELSQLPANNRELMAWQPAPRGFAPGEVEEKAGQTAPTFAVVVRRAARTQRYHGFARFA